MTANDDVASVRYIVDDVPSAVEFYVDQLGFTEAFRAGRAFADVRRGALRLLVSGPESSGARATPDSLSSAGRNRIHLIVSDLDSEIARLRAGGVDFCSDLVSGPGGRQILIGDPAGNLVELFEPARQG